MEWYYAAGGEQIGPVTEDVLKAGAADGTIGADTLVWHEGMAEWQPYSQVAGLAAEPTVEPEVAADESQAFCCECGNTFPVDEMVAYENTYVCASCKPTFFQRVQEGAALPGMVEYGGFWIRVAAKLIDGVILSAISMVFSFIAGILAATMATAGSTEVAFAIQMILMAIQLAVGAAYTAFFLGRYQATPGKMVCKLKVVRSDGERITYGRAVGRHFAEILSSLILNIGYLMAAFDDEKRTLHDRICDTRVIKTS